MGPVEATSSGKTVLVTGGCGYIGSHTIVCLLQQSYDVVVVDNLINSSKLSLDRVCEIVGLDDKEREKRLKFHNVDICDESKLRQVFVLQHEAGSAFYACIHFAGLKVSSLISASSLSNFKLGSWCETTYIILLILLKAVGESTRIPIRYYENNLIGTFVLLRLLDEFQCHSIVFSSSATGKSMLLFLFVLFYLLWTHFPKSVERSLRCC